MRVMFSFVEEKTCFFCENVLLLKGFCVQLLKDFEREENSA